MSYRYHTADVFTDKMFGGNQLAVIMDARGLSTEQMQSITREFNYPESVFLFPAENPANTKRVRIFTPGYELPFAGHPTVGCAWVLAKTGEIDLDGGDTEIILEEGVGPVPVRIRSENGVPVFAQLTAAKIPERSDSPYDIAAVAASVSLDPDDIDLANGNAVEHWSAGLKFLHVPLKSLDALERARLKLHVWENTYSDDKLIGAYIFVPDGNDYRVRMFGPDAGVPEDPATGSACAALGGYIGARSSLRDGMLRHSVIQGVEMGRPSRMELEVDLAGGAVKAVRVGGSSVLVASGELHIG